MPLMDLLRRLLPSRRRPEDQPLVPTDWQIAKAVNHETGAVAVLRIRSSKPQRDDMKDLTTAIVIKWACESEDGLPPSHVRAEQLQFERALDPLSENENSELVQVFTGQGLKEWTFYARSRESFMAQFNQLLADHPRYPVEIEFHEDPAWQIWAELRETLN